jgi:hypothetical protein
MIFILDLGLNLYQQIILIFYSIRLMEAKIKIKEKLEIRPSLEKE